MRLIETRSACIMFKYECMIVEKFMTYIVFIYIVLAVIYLTKLSYLYYLVKYNDGCVYYIIFKIKR